jgi:hypothetical protein
MFVRLRHHLSTFWLMNSFFLVFELILPLKRLLIDCLIRLTALNDSHSVAGIFCDLKKAFDCMNHKILLSKLKLYGVSGLVHKLIASYLTGKFQRIKLQVNDCSQNTYSNWDSVSHGVPQRSILGPLFFLQMTPV